MNREAIEFFEALKQDKYAFTERDKEMFDVALQALSYDDAKYHEEHGEVVIADVVWEDAIQALETVSHLKDRPCEACEYHTERGCSQWDCVFDKVLYGGD